MRPESDREIRIYQDPGGFPPPNHDPPCEFQEKSVSARWLRWWLTCLESGPPMSSQSCCVALEAGGAKINELDPGVVNVASDSTYIDLDPLQRVTNTLLDRQYLSVFHSRCPVWSLDNSGFGRSGCRPPLRLAAKRRQGTLQSTP